MWPLANFWMNFLSRKLESLGYPSVKNEDFVILACVVFTQCQRVTDRQTDRDGRTDIPIVASTGLAATLTPCNKSAHSSIYVIRTLRISHQQKRTFSNCCKDFLQDQRPSCRPSKHWSITFYTDLIIWKLHMSVTLLVYVVVGLEILHNSST